MDCLFCQISQGKIPAKIQHQDPEMIAFHDIHPQAPQHVLIVPHKHIATVNDLHQEDLPLIGRMFDTAKKIAKDLNISEAGYRLVMNCNASAGQTVFHIHLHLLGGRDLRWPPG